jgi:hypothetical protein
MAMTETKEDLVYANGLDGETGKYLVEPMTYGQVVDFVKGRSPKAPLLQRVEAIWRRFKDGKLDLPNGRRYERVDEAGWAVVFHPDEDPLVKKALRRLKEHRMSLIKDEQVVKELVYDGQQGVDDWLVGHGVEDEVIPWRVPYYLLPSAWNTRLDIFTLTILTTTLSMWTASSSTRTERPRPGVRR